MTPEGKLKQKVKEALNRQGIWYFMPVSMGMGTHGIPDFVGCMNGRAFFIETKVPGRKLTALQVRQKRLIEEAGGYYMVVRDEGDICSLRLGLGIT